MRLEKLLPSIRKQVLCLTVETLLLVLVHFLRWNIREGKIKSYLAYPRNWVLRMVSVLLLRKKFCQGLRKMWSLLLFSSNPLSSLIFIYSNEKQLLWLMKHLINTFLFFCNCAHWMLIIFKGNDFKIKPVCFFFLLLKKMELCWVVKGPGVGDTSRANGRV